MAIIDGGLSSLNKANVDANYNLQVRTPISGTQAGFVALEAEIDPGTYNNGVRIVQPLDASYDSRLRVAVDTPLFIDRFAGAAQNTALWNYANTNNTFAQANGWASINATALVAASNYGLLKSYRSFPTWAVFGTSFNCWMQLSQLATTYNTTEWGLGIAATTAAPTDGVFFRLTAAGALNCVISSISTGSYQETYVTAPGGAAYVGQNITHRFTIKCQSDQATFYIDGNVVAVVTRPAAGDFINASSELPVFFRTYTLGGTAAVGQIMRISAVEVHMQDALTSKPWADIMCGMGQHGSQGQTGGTMGSTAAYTNSTNPTSAAQANTTALITGFGGAALTTAPGIAGGAASGGASTDYIITNYANAAGTNAIPGRTLYIHGVRVGCVNLGAAVTTTPTTFTLNLNYGMTSVSLATTEAATTKKPRIIPLGTMYFPVASVIGATPQNGDVWMPFAAPITVAPGENVSVSFRCLVGSATASELFYFTVGFDSYWE